ncbi:helix-turn-helix transcriptional regulator [uncultured Brevibacillus sp.]|uniref:helix-turn-helix domain-containing protein n=1 Tax=uncultured Brevibacillus sp. TaxID=169970 RepID=UPI0025961C8A|nr:helix-turn-helix transcriptional regulator [uncultured Brevibacillus sp.]
MIKCNLAVILAERGIKITDLANVTGISRTTLTALYYNQGKGIQFDTLDKLCNFLDVAPGQLLLHIQYNVDVKMIEELGLKKFLFKMEYVIGETSYLDDVLVYETKTDHEAKKIYLVIEFPRKLFNNISVIPEYNRIAAIEDLTLTIYYTNDEYDDHDVVTDVRVSDFLQNKDAPE